MTQDQEEAGEDLLAGIDVHLWRVPPPAALHQPSLLGRALTPAAVPAKRGRLAWLMAAFVLLNAAIATVIVILLARPAVTQTIVAAAPAGGGGGTSVDARVAEVLRRLEQQQRELERKLDEIQDLRALVLELAQKVRQYEQDPGHRDRTVPKKQAASEVETEVRTADPFERIRPDGAPCDEVSCVLTNYEGKCCEKFHLHAKDELGTNPYAALPVALDRAAISRAMAAVKPRVMACGDLAPAKGRVKISVRVNGAGVVTSTVIESTPDFGLGRCVEQVVQKAAFDPTQSGGSFTYPFVF
jgi:TonB family protein